MKFYRFFARFYERAGKRMCRDCESFIEKGAKILDLGCGCGIVSKTFQDFFQAELIGVDIKDQRVVEIPFQIITSGPLDISGGVPPAIGGKNFPFSDNSFDVILINYVLHHAEAPEVLLREAKRITNNKIIIFEDLPEGFLTNLICKIHSLSYKYFFQKNNENGKFLNEAGWEKLLSDLELRLIFEKKVSHALNPLKKKLFVLEKI